MHERVGGGGRWLPRIAPFVESIAFAVGDNRALFNEGRDGFGLGFGVIEHLGRSGVPGSVGLFEWGGAYHTDFWGDPKEQVVAVLMEQLLPSGGSDLHGKFRALVYQAIVAPVKPTP